MNGWHTLRNTFNYQCYTTFNATSQIVHLFANCKTTRVYHRWDLVHSPDLIHLSIYQSLGGRISGRALVKLHQKTRSYLFICQLQKSKKLQLMQLALACRALKNKQLKKAWTLEKC